MDDLGDVRYLVMEFKKTNRVRYFKKHEDTKDKQWSKLAIVKNSKIFASSYFKVFFGKSHRVAALKFLKAIKGNICWRVLFLIYSYSQQTHWIPLSVFFCVYFWELFKTTSERPVSYTEYFAYFYRHLGWYLVCTK